MTQATARPAHRPSRRGDVVEACLLLLASRPIDEVTVADIAATADMTSAAIYYHFVSKEDILREGMQQFSEAMLCRTRECLAAATEAGDDVGVALTGLIAWLDTRKAAATVYFATSSGQSLSVELIRRLARIESIDLLTGFLRQSRPTITEANAGVAAVGLLSLLETASASWLVQDQDLLTLGPRRFLDTVERFADEIVGPNAEVASKASGIRAARLRA